MLPFIDESNTFYGSEIYLYRAELKQLGVITNFKDGAKWIKNKFVYKRPDECLLFLSDWKPYLKLGDGPSIDEEFFFRSEIGSYKEVLNVLGVITDVKMGCKLIHIYLNSMSFN
ncbi:hypothetical protein Tco_0025957 [Tanacetum coccineum]